MKPCTIVMQLFILVSVSAFGDIGGTLQGAYDDSEQFHFVVMGDRTGQEEKGVFKQILQKVNQLGPAFVLSVGDNIQGYTDDPNSVPPQWDEFEAFIKILKTPYLKVPGNHDISNEMMAEFYRQRYQKLYYHTVYKNVLFLFLNTDDPSAHVDLAIRAELDAERRAIQQSFNSGKYSLKLYLAIQQYQQKNRDLTGGQISGEQYDYFQKVLADNQEVRWTFVVMHKPVWRKSSPPQNWLKLEEQLSKRPYTVFAGHEHLHVYTKRNNRDYIQLGTSGGSGLPDIMPGVYQHFLWVAMGAEEPAILNMLNEGILEKDDIRAFGRSAVNENGRP